MVCARFVAVLGAKYRQPYAGMGYHVYIMGRLQLLGIAPLWGICRNFLGRAFVAWIDPRCSSALAQKFHQLLCCGYFSLLCSLSICVVRTGNEFWSKQEDV